MDDINVTLANYPGLGSVRLCECNSIHLNIGPVTVTLSPEAFVEAAILVRNAMEQLREIVGARQGGDNPFQSGERQHNQFVH
jgi:hypothetical protein